MLSEAEKAYAAGLFDGEGCIIIEKPRRGKGHTLMVQLGMREPAAVAWLQERWPASLRLTPIAPKIVTHSFAGTGSGLLQPLPHVCVTFFLTY